MTIEKKGIVLVGHGGLPSDFPEELVSKLKRLEAVRRKNNLPISDEENQIDKTLRNWPRNKDTDPYQAGLQAVAESLKPLLEECDLEVAYNEFCSPTIKEAVRILVENGNNNITIICTMFTPGGSHSEIEIPEEINELKEMFPNVKINYAWPFDLEHVANFLKGHLSKHLEPKEA
ncbi:MAG: CbiX/SirB N-terminal domain-containing protein [Nitrospinota bacterium]